MFYRSFIQNTQSEKLVRGLLGLAGLWVLSFVLPLVRLNLLATFLHYTALFLSLSLIVVFQSELRKFMALKIKSGILCSVCTLRCLIWFYLNHSNLFYKI